MSTRRLVGGFLVALLFAGCDSRLLDLLLEEEDCHGGGGNAQQFLVPIEVSPPEATAQIAGIDVDKAKPGSATVGTFSGTLAVQKESVSSAGGDDVFLLRLDGDGKLASLRRFGDAREQTAADVAVDDRDNIVFAGRFLGQMDFGHDVVIASQGTTTNAFLAKLDHSGRALWALDIPLANDCCIISVEKVATDPSGNVFVTGTLEGTAIFAGHPVQAPGLNNYLVKLSPAGEFIWGTVFRGADQMVVGLRVRRDGQPVVGEVDARGVRFFLLRWSADGNLLLDRAYGGTLVQDLHDLALDEQSNMVISGTGAIVTRTTPEEDEREFLALLTPDGDPIWVVRFTDRAASHLATDKSGRIFVAGRLFTGAPSIRSFVAEFDHDGKQKEIRELALGVRIDDLAAWRPSKVVFGGALGDPTFGAPEPTPNLFVEGLKL